MQNSSMISGDISSDTIQQCPGSFTNVYLQSLQLAAQWATSFDHSIADE